MIYQKVVDFYLLEILVRELIDLRIKKKTHRHCGVSRQISKCRWHFPSFAFLGRPDAAAGEDAQSDSVFFLSLKMLVLVSLSRKSMVSLAALLNTHMLFLHCSVLGLLLEIYIIKTHYDVNYRNLTYLVEWIA